MLDASLYKLDFHIHSLKTHIPNERFLIAHLYALFGSRMHELALLAHALFSTILIAGVYSIASDFIRNKPLALLVPLFLFGILEDLSLGGNELYYESLIASLVAKSIAVWSLLYFIRENWLYAFVFLIPVTLIHPIAGAQLFILFLSVSLFRWFVERVPVSGPQALGVLIFLLTAGLYIIYLKLSFSANVSEAEVFQIFRFRLPHHYFPSTFLLRDFVAFVVMFAAAIYFFVKRSKPILLFLSINFAALCFYTFMVEVASDLTILTTQWFKTTIWIELLGVVALMSISERALGSFLDKYIGIVQWGLLVLGVMASIAIVSDYKSLTGKIYEFPGYSNCEIKMGKWVLDNTEPSATFLVPPKLTRFKYYSERASIFDIKALPLNKEGLSLWAKRLERIYGLSYEHNLSHGELFRLVESKLKLLDEQALMALKSEYGVTHILTTADHRLNFEQVIKDDNCGLVIYEIKNSSY